MRLLCVLCHRTTPPVSVADADVCICLLQTTVREALVVSATLRLWETRDKALVEAFVDEVLQLVELDSSRDALVRRLAKQGLFKVNMHLLSL
jgi:hypothetical protein